MIIYKHMRLLLLHFNSGRIPCWSPTRAAPSPSSVWVASSRAWFRSSMLSKVNDYILEAWHLNLLWRLHEGDFKACCYHSVVSPAASSLFSTLRFLSSADSGQRRSGRGIRAASGLSPCSAPHSMPPQLLRALDVGYSSRPRVE